MLRNHYSRWGKRTLDVLIAVVLVIALLPVFAILVVLIRVKLGSPVFFCQQRAGKQGKPFMLYKFRTMMDLFDELPRLHIDELLQPFRLLHE